MSVLTDTTPTPEIHESGEQITEAQPGSLNCLGCGFGVSLTTVDALPECPNCGGTRFRRTSIFSQSTMDTDAVEAPKTAPLWLPEVREGLEGPGYFLAFENPDGDVEVVKLEEGWTRIGRSGSAEVQFDDATVSRRHALVVLTEERELRAMDDRSLNGLFVNGERVEWAALSDGDELEIGRYRLYVLAPE
jgi:predicted RNA-binding Zn-ribbon protein involved in translation (DUF1610 family)